MALASGTRLNRDVAITVLPDAFARDRDRLARFTREAQTLASLNHPNIAQIYGIENNAIVMELVDGEDLSARVARALSKRGGPVQHPVHQPWVKAILHRAYTSDPVARATRLLQDRARRLEAEHPSAADSVREGLEETLTIIGFGLSASLRRSLRTTNAAESLISRTRHVKRHVTRWRGGRWCDAGRRPACFEAVKGFRRVKGHKDMPPLNVNSAVRPKPRMSQTRPARRVKAADTCGCSDERMPAAMRSANAETIE